MERGLQGAVGEGGDVRGTRGMHDAGVCLWCWGACMVPEEHVWCWVEVGGTQPSEMHSCYVVFLCVGVGVPNNRLAPSPLWVAPSYIPHRSVSDLYKMSGFKGDCANYPCDFKLSPCEE